MTSAAAPPFENIEAAALFPRGTPFQQRSAARREAGVGSRTSLSAGARIRPESSRSASSPSQCFATARTRPRRSPLWHAGAPCGQSDATRVTKAQPRPELRSSESARGEKVYASAESRRRDGRRQRRNEPRLPARLSVQRQDTQRPRDLAQRAHSSHGQMILRTFCLVPGDAQRSMALSSAPRSRSTAARHLSAPAAVR